ncbi:fatty acid desaturase [Streptomyces bobili]|uniref:fatty acid desaturase n=1 Tax=Streptomyces bobili TaxID=67280 RepID=UPI00381CB75B
MATRRGNRVIGHLLTGLLGEGFAPYRSSHYVHHAKLGSDDDPMFQSYRAGNIRAAGRAPSRREFVLRVIVRNAVWRLPKTAVLTLVTRAPGEAWRALARPCPDLGGRRCRTVTRGRRAVPPALLAAPARLGCGRSSPGSLIWATTPG